MKKVPTAAYAFAAELQAFADAHDVRMLSVRAEARTEKRDFLSVFFSVPRPKEVAETTEVTKVENTVEPDDTTDNSIDEPVDDPVEPVNLAATIQKLESDLDTALESLPDNDAESVEKEEVM